MPILGGFIASFFSWVAALFAMRVSVGVAAAGAFVVTLAAGVAAFQAAVFAVKSGLAAVASPAVVSALGYFIPSNVAACLGAMLLVDTICIAFEFWRGSLGFAIAIAK